MSDEILHPEHYTRYRTEVITITRHLPFCLGNVVKYVLRAPFKDGYKDCDKALTYLGWCNDEPLRLDCTGWQALHASIKAYRKEVQEDDSSAALIWNDFLETLEFVIANGSCQLLRRSIERLHGLLKGYTRGI